MNKTGEQIMAEFWVSNSTFFSACLKWQVAKMGMCLFLSFKVSSDTIIGREPP